jgi:hypothetical protein
MQLKIGEIASLNALSQSRSLSEFFLRTFCGTALAREQARAKQHHNPHSFFVCGIHQDGICCCCPSRLLCFVGDSVPDAAG